MEEDDVVDYEVDLDAEAEPLQTELEPAEVSKERDEDAGADGEQPAKQKLHAPNRRNRRRNPRNRQPGAHMPEQGIDQ